MPLFQKFYDLLIPIVVYLGFFRSPGQSISIVVFFGLIMDSLCGGPVGLYITIYIWLYLILRWLSQFLHTANLWVLAVAVTGAVAFEISILLAYMALLAPSAIIPKDAAKTIFLQIAWALLTGPLILVIISWTQKRLDFWRAKIFADWRNMQR